MKKVLNIIRNVIVILVVVFAVGMMIFTIVSVNTFDRADRNFFGYKAFIALSDSMSKTDFKAGDLVLVKEVDPTTLKEGDIIAYQSVSQENYGEVVTHKIRELTTAEDGSPGFVTYGTTTDENDEDIVTYSMVIGKYQNKLPGVGKFFQFLKTVPGYIVCIFVPFVILILLQGINSIRLFRQYKKEQLEELETQRKKERAEIAEERKQLEEQQAESQRIMAELLRLKNELTDPKSSTAVSKEQPVEKNTCDDYSH